MSVFVAGCGLAIGAVWAASLWKRGQNCVRLTVAQVRRENELGASEAARQAQERGITETHAWQERKESELQGRQRVLHEFGQALAQREAFLVERDLQIEWLVQDTTRRATVLAPVARRVQHLSELVAQVGSTRLRLLEGKGALTAQEILSFVLQDETAHAILTAQAAARRQEERLAEHARKDAHRTLAAATDRIQDGAHGERLASSMPVRNPRVAVLLADRAGPYLRRFQEEVGCDVEIRAGDAEATLKGEDPVAREVARRVLDALNQKAITAAGPLTRLCLEVRREVDLEIERAAQEAVDLLGITGLHGELKHLIGSLRFRLSASQNQWRHSVEVARLAGIMAAELGLDAALARRAGLLHDIGKAVTHDQEGAHAVLGAQLARRLGENEVVANAIGAHHFDEEPAGPLAYVVTAADALSGARPGARRENLKFFTARVDGLLRIARRIAPQCHPEVMHAGRELRVWLEHDAGGDALVQSTAERIADVVERELVYPGQIRITVVRETVAQAVA